MDKIDVSEFIEEAREIAGSCWSDERVKDRIMDDELAEVVAERIVPLLKEIEVQETLVRTFVEMRENNKSPNEVDVEYNIEDHWNAINNLEYKGY